MKGDIVDYHSIIDEPATSFEHTIQHIGMIPSCKRPVAWISNKSGCVTVEALSFSNGYTPARFRDEP
jgi:hypothetical protein